MFTITKKHLMVNGKVVASIPNEQAFTTLFSTLMATLPQRDKVFMAVAYLGEARTAEVARLVRMDRSNTARILDILEVEEVVEVVDDCDSDGKAGRPSRVWAIA